MNTHRKLFRISTRGISLILSLALGMSALAAEYNFYFNNTEQGDNATNNPNFNLNGQAAETKGKENASDNPGVVPPAIAPGLTSTPQSIAKLDSPNDLPSDFKLLAGLARMRTEYWSDSYYSYHSASLLLGSRINQHFGVSAVGTVGIKSEWGEDSNWNAGAELEWLPGRLSELGPRKSWELALLGGAFLRTTRWHEDDHFQAFGHSFKIAPYFGTRLTLKLDSLSKTLGSNTLLAADIRFAQNQQIFGIGMGVTL